MQAASTGCNACAAGTHAPTGGASSCALCPVNTYSSAQAATECRPCPAGQNTSGPGASYAGRCVLPGGAPCDVDNCTCPPGYYVLHDIGSASASCKPCAHGTYLAEASQQTVCEHCGAVREHSVTLAPATTHPEACVCPPGRVRSGDAKTCALCAHGKFNPVHNGSCIACAGDGNTTANTGAQSPDDCHCGIGFEPQTGGTAGCTPCTPGAASPGHGASCVTCGADQYVDASAGECTQCPAGKRAGRGTEGIGGCLKCGNGLGWNAVASQCEHCGGAAYGPDSEQQLCVPCAEGQKAVDNICTACTLGWTRHAGDKVCERCPANTYGVYEPSTDNPERAVCRECGQNMITPPGSSREESCICALGYAMYDGGCTHCPDGTRMVFPATRGDQLQCVPCDGVQCVCIALIEKSALLTGGCVPSQCASGTLKRAYAVVRSPYLLHGDGQSNYSNLLVELLAETVGVCTEHVQVTRLELPTGTSRRMLEHEQELAPEEEYRYNATVLYPAADESMATTFSNALEQSGVFHIERPGVTPTPEPVDPPPSTSGAQKTEGSIMLVGIWVIVSIFLLIVVLIAAHWYFNKVDHSGLKEMNAHPSAFDIDPEPQKAPFYASVFHGAYPEAGPTCFHLAEGGACAACMGQHCGHCVECGQPTAVYRPLFF